MSIFKTINDLPEKGPDDIKTTDDLTLGDGDLTYRSSVESFKVVLTGVGINNQDATVPPTVNDDSSLGYRNGSNWIDQVGGNSYILLDDTAGAAVWKNQTPPSNGDMVSTNNLSDLDDAAIARTNLGVELGTNTAGITDFVSLSQAAYDALSPPLNTTLYIITS